MHRTATRIVAVILLVTAVLNARAHHSFAEFDSTKLVSIEGEVQELRLINPHSALLIKVAQQDGSVAEWRVELGAPVALRRRGVTVGSLPPGTRVNVSGFQARDGTLRLAPRRIALGDGREFAYE
jgi:hypothetical protein